MSIALITGSLGLVGSEASQFFLNKGFEVIGIDNYARKSFFGANASTKFMEKILSKRTNYFHHNVDIQNTLELKKILKKYRKNISTIIHTAAQPSHDYAGLYPVTDFSINAFSTINLLDAYRTFCPDAKFIFTSSNKVYGTHPNLLPFDELETRWEIKKNHPFYLYGINETMSIDQTTHSFLGSSKLSADVLVQEYGNYYGLNTTTFRCGCITGPNHAGTQLHGFLSYLVKCNILNKNYTVFGYRGKQVRDNIHSFDLVNMFWHSLKKNSKGVVYNAGGGRENSCSILEAISLIEQISGKKMKVTFKKHHRKGDHIWYISDNSKFENDHKKWKISKNLKTIVCDIFESELAKSKIKNLK